MEKYNPTQEEVKMAIDTCKALNLDFGGVDILFGENGPILCEVNSMHILKIFTIVQVKMWLIILLNT